MTGHSQLFSRDTLFGAVFFGLFIYLLYLAARIASPLMSPLLWAAILALALRPLHVRLLRRMKERRGLAAAAMTVLTFFLVIGPAVTVLVMLTAQAIDLYQWSGDLVQSGRITEFWNRINAAYINKVLTHPALKGIDIKGMIMKAVGNLSSELAGQIGGLVKNSLVFVIDLAIMLVALFFFYRDGERYYNTLIGLLPFSQRHKEAISNKITSTFSAVIYGVFLIALFQGVMTGIGFLLFHVPFAIFWGFLATVLALFPVGGAALVWLPGAVYLYLTGSPSSAVMLALWGALFVSLPDNFLKPLLIGRRANISTFILFVALLGGVQAFGFLGLLFGPLVATLVTLFIQIYHEEFAEQ
ncbi:MAG TPA: AI-2E family transporter [Nitrospirota bacterium]|nr:AI-2E family transporter [Nitrospirota bacterium]